MWIICQTHWPGMKYNIPIFHDILKQYDHLYGRAGTWSIIIHLNRCLLFFFAAPRTQTDRALTLWALILNYPTELVWLITLCICSYCCCCAVSGLTLN